MFMIRGRGLHLPKWWLDAARASASAYGESMAALGVDLAKAVGRKTPWRQPVISRLLQGQNPTVELTEAFHVLLGLPRVNFTPASIEEALALEAASSRFQKRGSRLDELDRQLDAMEKDIEDQTTVVASADERAEVGRSARSIIRGRT